ncbi:MAG: sensor domain-containing diguanylate cyclase [Planctomycetia bacterium]|nr:sensor domain-containing diguanylate cyclase [Planctomycetia bacterium]
MPDQQPKPPESAFFHGLEDALASAPAPHSGTRHLEHLRRILDVSKALISTLSQDVLLERVMDAMLEVSQAERGFLMLKDADGHLKVVTARRMHRENLPPEEFRVSNSIVERVLSTQEPLFLPNVSRDESLSRQSSVVELGIRFAMCAPLRFRDHVKGAVYVDSHNPGDASTQEDFEVFRSLADQAAIALENAELYTRAVTDPLTALYNRSYFQRRLDEELDRARRYSRRLSLLLVDVDHFKQINDTYGHQVGDRVLIRVAQLMRASIRSADVPARYGGDEFALILPETDGEATGSAGVVAERLRKAVANDDFGPLGLPQKISLSIGLTTLKPEKPATAFELLERADRALYEAKRAGRNRSVSDTRRY